MTGDGDQDVIGIARIDCDLRNLLPIAQPEMRPGLPRIDRFVDAVSYRKVRTLQSFTAANINNIRIGSRDRDASNGAGWLVVKYRRPRAAVVISLPNAAVDLSNVEDVRLRWHTGDRARAASAKWANAAPVKRLE